MSEELAALAHPSHGRLLDIIRASGPISRVEIAQESGMTGASVTNIVRLLLDLELVKEIGQAESTGGKRRTLLTIAPESRYAVGIHVQRESTTYSVSDMAGRMVGRRASAFPARGDVADLTRRLADDVEALLRDLDLHRERVVGVGVACSRSLDLQTHLGDRVANELSRALALPVVVDREAVAAAIGEFWQGTAAQPSSFATLYMGDEFGAGLVDSGVVWRGAASNAGDIGHIEMGDDTPCECGGRGCLQAIASRETVVAAAARAGLLRADERGSVADRFDEVARRAARGDSRAAALLDRSAAYVARAAVVIASVMDVEMVILAGSGFAVPGAIYAQRIREALDQYARRQGLPPVLVDLAYNPRDAAAVGASALVLQGALAPRA